MYIPIVRVCAIGLQHRDVFIAHDRGNWGPEQQHSDCKQHPLQYDPSNYIFFRRCEDILVPGEEFKLVVPVSDKGEAWQIYKTRQAAGVHVGHRFDYDAQQRTFWLLTPGFPVVRFGEWNQNNICTLTADEQHHQQGKA